MKLANLFEIRIFPAKDQLANRYNIQFISIPATGEVNLINHKVSYMDSGIVSMLLHDEDVVILSNALKEHLEAVEKLEKEQS